MSAKRVAIGLILAYSASFFALLTVPSAMATQGALTIDQELPTEVDGESKKLLSNGRLPVEAAVFNVNVKAVVTVPGGEACPLASIKVTFTADNGGKDFIIVAPTSVGQVKPYPTSGGSPVPLANTAGTPVSFNAQFGIQLTKKAPAFAPFEIKFNGLPEKLGGQDCSFTSGSIKQVGSYSVTPDYQAIMQYDPSLYFAKTGQNRQVTITVKMTNLGNYETKVVTEPIEDGKKRLGTILPPGPQTIQSIAGGAKVDNTANALLTVKTPYSNGYTNSIYTFKAKFTGVNSNGVATTSKSEEQLTFSVQVQGVYVPGFDPFVALGAIGIAMLFLGSVRRRE